ncbi:hypothetical protein, variant [Verruconis gallopava]|uniref:Protein MAK16 n=1 Tax=Verruconis gallopava TaxID=253628 RepID=A0A0D1X8P0_9PEZI|nr:uncharacterized protein PV09_09782 [Verruconis gallopava]XP_016208255.1 hypothetical protein, variant [Verruconis gallopava]KIV98384.1 hypothetical protein PV09_09782 [Verruconis gallopava]KIV98385.1 hypothetical protein, variant [Verruconis gallopava]
MASDEIVWDIINNQFCSFKIKTSVNQSFCRNEYNVSGYCSKQHCPLANSRYATVRSDAVTGRLYLYMKTAERAHLPSRWWERVRLPSNYSKALEVIDERLIYWPKFLVHKCKQRLTRLTQVAIRTKKLQNEEVRLDERLVAKLAPKVRQREGIMERKAEASAKVERAIERELIERLRSGAYGDRPLNIEEGLWKRVLRGLESTGEGIHDEDLDDGIDEEELEMLSEKELEYTHEPAAEVEYISDDIDTSSEGEELGDLEDWLDGTSSRDSAIDNEERCRDNASRVTSPVENVKSKTSVQPLKRRQGASGNQPPHKKPQTGPRRQIEYEFEKAEHEIPQFYKA